MHNSTASVTRLAEDIEKGIRPGTNHTVAVRFGEIAITVRTNSESLRCQLEEYYRSFLVERTLSADIGITALESKPVHPGCSFVIKQPDPGKHTVKEEYCECSDGRIVRKRLTGMLFLFGNGQNLAVGPCNENANQVINFINNRYIQFHLNNGYLLGHAAAVLVGGTGIALAGFSGAGKSTLALQIMNRGASFVSNDRLLIKKDGSGLSMAGVAKLPRVNPGTILHNDSLAGVISRGKREELFRLDPDELWGLEDKYDIFIEDIFGSNKFRLFSSMDILVVLTWKQHNGPLRISQAAIHERRDLLGAFIKSPGLFYEPDMQDPASVFSEKAYIEHLQRCRVFEFAGGVDFEKAADVCANPDYLLQGAACCDDNC